MISLFPFLGNFKGHIFRNVSTRCRSHNVSIDKNDQYQFHKDMFSSEILECLFISQVFIQLGFIFYIVLDSNPRFLFCIHKQLSQPAFEWSVHSHTFVTYGFHMCVELFLSLLSLYCICSIYQFLSSLDSFKYYCFILCILSCSSNLSLKVLSFVNFHEKPGGTLIMFIFDL